MELKLKFYVTISILVSKHTVIVIFFRCIFSYSIQIQKLAGKTTNNLINDVLGFD